MVVCKNPWGGVGLLKVSQRGSWIVRLTSCYEGSFDTRIGKSSVCREEASGIL